MKHRILLIIIVLCLPLWLNAQTVKRATISADESFTDHLTLQQDSKDTDIMVKFQFDEENDLLTVSLISYRRLFVFQEDVRYSHVVRHKRLRPEKFPYVVTVDKKQRFKLSNGLRKSIDNPRRKHVFKRWLNYEGLIPQPMEFQMVNDFIEQKFDIKNRQSMVAVTLRDVFLIDRDSKHNNKWWLVCGNDFNTKYEIAIRRNPCMGLDADIQAASQSLTDLQKGYKPLKAKFGNGKVTSQEALALFQKLQSTLQQQFPRRTATTECPTLKNIWNHYNELLDSIGQMKCTLVAVPEPLSSEEAVGAGNLDANNLYGRARQIDELVVRWLLSTDDAERDDIVRQCEQTIKYANALIRFRGAQTEEQRRAIKVFRAAERYYHKTISR